MYVSKFTVLIIGAMNNIFHIRHVKANIYAIASDTDQLQFIKLHHFKQERF